MLFKILQGPSSRISTEATPLHEGYAYFTPDTAGFYIDSQVNGVLTRVQVNPDQVLQAVRNETTYQDIASATERGCAVLCVDGSVVYQLANLNTSTKTALFISMYEVDSDSVAHIRAWTVMEEDDGTTTWERHSKVTTEAVVDAVTEQNTSADQKFWRGTQAEYDAIEDKDDSVLYIVTDEDEGSTVVVGDMKAEFYDADLSVKDAGGIAAFVQAKVDGVTVSSLGAAAADHIHDERYYTETEVDSKLSGKSDTGHTHTKSEITDFPTSMPASDVSAWAKAATKPTYTASEVGAIPTSQKGTANGVASLGSDGKVPSGQLPTISVDAYTKAETLTDATAALFGLGTGAVPDDVLAKIKTFVDAANANADTKAKLEAFEYTGTGTYGYDNPTTLTFSFAPRIVLFSGVGDKVLFGYNKSALDSNYNILCDMSVLTTDYKDFLGPGLNTYGQSNYAYPSAKKSSDGKTLMWYSGGNSPRAYAQYNDSGVRYSGIAIG